MKVEWIKNATIYQIMVDRFSTGNVFKDNSLAGKTSRDWMGGNLKGTMKKISHIKKVADTLYISPVYKTISYDGYEIEDFFKIEPRFGKEEDLIKLIKTCHLNDLKIILDFVPNHISIKSPLFIDAQKNKFSKYREWFLFKEWPNEYLAFLDVKKLPKINVENKEARDYVISAAEKWVALGIDGFRLDHAIGPSLKFWREFKNRIKKINKKFVLIGEVGKARGAYWNESFKKECLETIWLLKSFSKNERKRISKIAEKSDFINCIEFNDLMMKKLENVLDGCIDFSFRDLMWAVNSGKLSLQLFWKILDNHYKKFRKDYSLITLLSNHDCGRFISIFGREKTKIASSFQLLLDKPGMIYYGEEIGLRGKISEDCRRFMIWNHKKWNLDLFDHYKTLYEIRNKR